MSRIKVSFLFFFILYVYIFSILEFDVPIYVKENNSSCNLKKKKKNPDKHIGIISNNSFRFTPVLVRQHLMVLTTTCTYAYASATI